MPNSKLKDKIYPVPFKVIKRITNSLSRIKVDTGQDKGYKRAKDIVDSGKISEPQMKRLKNYFDSYEGDGKDNEFMLIGGGVTRKWVNDTLGHDRESIKKVKTIKKDSGLENQFIRTHEKDNNNKNVGKANGGMIDIKKSSNSKNIMANDAIYKENYNKEIKNIKYLIEYLSKT
tara:strand:+ start:3046 stop:3567 length:522 start_codon:yes stop_codon:yes gene_type:complete